jgi:hypothetical protein
MDPEAYVKLLFDDGNFSRSRLYFWVIGCLNEFDISIEHIKQCTLFREARVRQFLGKTRETCLRMKAHLPRSSFEISLRKSMTFVRP